MDLRYPVGKFDWTAPVDPAERPLWIAEVAGAESLYRAAVQGLTEEQLDTPYRPGGWTIRQVIHHVPDSHMNAFVRFRLALTEDTPTIKPYDEALWAELHDSRTAPVEWSLCLLGCLHRRWVRMLEGVPAAGFERRYNHPENGVLTMNTVLAAYAWHTRHHAAHITALRERMGWQ